IASVSEGIMIIRKRMASKPILLVLDDVDHREQLEALAGSPDWFFPGSCIIFTSKDQQLLRSHQVDEIHEMDFLDDYESLELFCLYAFRQHYPTQVFKELALQFVQYLQGHPLVLKVFGCFLYKKSVRVWRSELDRLHTYPNSEIQKKLRPTFDGLDFDQKRIFLDIAFSLIGENKDFAASVLENSDCFPDSNMEVLVDKSLITVSSNLLHMHELIQSMAREIVREESNIPGNRSRLSVPSEVYDVLHKNKATETVELSRDAKLTFSGILEHLPNNIRYLCWHGYPFKLLPSNFYPQSIVAIDLSYSRIKQLWLTPKCFKRLKVMNLRIKSLVELHVDRTAIREFPSFVFSLENLQSLSFGGHQEIPSRWWPSISSPFSLLSKKQHPKSLVSCTSGGLPLLQFMNLSYCNIFQVPDSIGGLSCLKSLNLGGNNFTSLPRSLSQLSQLGSLTLDGCNKLEVLPVLPHNLISSLSTYHCTSQREQIRELNLRFLSCNVTDRPNISRNLTIDASITSHGATNQLSSFLQRIIPHWFRNRNMGNHVMIRLPSDGCHNKFRGYGTCIVYKRKKPYGIPGYIVRNFDGAILGNASPFHCFPLNDNSIGIHESHVIWLHYNTSIWGWKEAKSFASFTFKDNEDVEVKECAVRLFCDEDIQQEADSMIQDLSTPTQKGGIFTLHWNSSISSLFW
ncbi:NB-ARC domains-containing protein, partial [Tanacetum coccineum]